MSEEELAAMSPTAAAVAKIVKPGMKLTEVKMVLNLVIFLQQRCSHLSDTYAPEKLFLKLPRLTDHFRKGFLTFFVCVCVCVCEREREKQRERKSFLVMLSCNTGLIK